MLVYDGVIGVECEGIIKSLDSFGCHFTLRYWLSCCCGVAESGDIVIGSRTVHAGSILRRMNLIRFDFGCKPIKTLCAAAFDRRRTAP